MNLKEKWSRYSRGINMADTSQNKEYNTHRHIILLMLGERINLQHDITEQPVVLSHFEQEIYCLCQRYSSIIPLFEYSDILLPNKHYLPSSDLLINIIINENINNINPLWIYNPSKIDDNIRAGNIILTDIGWQKYQDIYNNIVCNPNLHEILQALYHVHMQYSKLSNDDIIQRNTT